MESPAPTTKELHDKLRSFHHQVGSLINELRGPDQEAIDPDGKITTAELHKVESRLLARIQASEQFLTMQMEEQVVSSAVLITVFIVSALYVMQQWMRLMFRRHAHRRLDGWEDVVKAARLHLQPHDGATETSRVSG